MHKRAVATPTLRVLQSHDLPMPYFLDSIKNDLNYLISKNTLTESDLKSAMYLGMAKKYQIPIREANLKYNYNH